MIKKKIASILSWYEHDEFSPWKIKYPFSSSLEEACNRRGHGFLHTFWSEVRYLHEHHVITFEAEFDDSHWGNNRYDHLEIMFSDWWHSLPNWYKQNSSLRIYYGKKLRNSGDFVEHNKLKQFDL